MIMLKNKMVSIITSIYNCEDYVEEMLDSIINQTYQEWEMILIDDASTDNTWDIVQKYEDRRIIKIRNKKNLGLTVNLNKAIPLCKGKYIVRIDADDIACDNRIALQVDYMEKNSEVVIAGGYMKTFGERKEIYRNAVENNVLKINLLFNTIIFHPTFIIRKESMCNCGIRYNETIRYAQDYNLIYELSKIGEIANIPEILTYYRIHNRQISKEKYNEQKKCADYTRNQILNELGINLTDREFEYWSRFCLLDCHKLDNKEKEVLLNIKEQVIKSNFIKKTYSIELLSETLEQRMKWYLDNCDIEIRNKKNEEDKNKFLQLFKLMNQWVKIKQEGKSLSKYFEQKNIYRIAIYGLGDVGETLIKELKYSDIKIVYAIDRRASNIYGDITVVSPEDNLEEVEMIVVTAITYFDEIKKNIEKKISCQIVSIQDIINEI